MPGGDRDCRMTVDVPAEGWFIVQVRDNIYGGSDQARYRLRVDPSPVRDRPSSRSGGPRGRTIEVEVSRREPARAAPEDDHAARLPRLVRRARRRSRARRAGRAPGPAPGRRGARVVEPADRAGRLADRRPGLTVNGRIGRPGEVDSYRLAVKEGEKIRIRVEAEALGSWLDSVLTIRDEKGAIVAENDDSDEAVRPDQARSVNALGVPEASPDSSVEYEAKADGVLTDRGGRPLRRGGPGVRLSAGDRAGPAGLRDHAPARQRQRERRGDRQPGQVRAARTSPGQFGVFNLKPGATIPINFLVTPEGRPGPVEVRVEGLPEGVTAEPVKVRLAGPRLPGADRADAPAGGRLALLKVAPYAQPGLSEFRVVATARARARPVDRPRGDRDDRARHRRRSRRGRSPGSSPVPAPDPRRGPAPVRRAARPADPPEGDASPARCSWATGSTWPSNSTGAVTADDGSTVRGEGRGGRPGDQHGDLGGDLDRRGRADRRRRRSASWPRPRRRPGTHPVRVTYTPPGGPTDGPRGHGRGPGADRGPARAETIFLRPGRLGEAPGRGPPRGGVRGEVELKSRGSRGASSSPRPVDDRRRARPRPRSGWRWTRRPGPGEAGGIAGRRDGADAARDVRGRVANPADDPGPAGRQMKEEGRGRRRPIRGTAIGGPPSPRFESSRSAPGGDQPVTAGVSPRIGRAGRSRGVQGLGPGSAPSRKVNAMLWRHLCLVRAFSAAGLLTCSMLGASAAGEPAEPLPGADAAGRDRQGPRRREGRRRSPSRSGARARTASG